SSFTNDSGRAGAIAIDTRTLQILGGALVGSTGIDLSQPGAGNSGDISIVASDRIALSGRASFNNVETSSLITALTSTEGRAGNISIETGLFRVAAGGRVNTATSSSGQAGRLQINANTVQLLGGGGLVPSGLTSGTSGDGNGNNIVINSAHLQVLNGAQLVTRTGGSGNAGSVIVTASDRITLSGVTESGASVSRISSEVGIGSRGRGGNIKITTAALDILGGAELAASTFGRGDAGDIVITASDRVTLSGSTTLAFRSRVSTQVEGSAIDADGGDIRINAPVLRILEGAEITASTLGIGDAGTVIVNAGDRLIIDGALDLGPSSGIFTTTDASAMGSGGTIRLSATDLRLANGGVINARTRSRKPGGDIRIQADEVDLVNGGQVITTASARGPAGDITLRAGDVRLSGRDASFAVRQARAAEFSSELDNVSDGRSGLFANTQALSEGPGGSIAVGADRLTISDRAIISAQSDGGGTAGNIRIDAADALQLDSGDVTTAAANNSGGNILINAAPEAQSAISQLRGDSDITTDSQGDGGNITIRGAGIVAFDDSDIVSRSRDASGGDISLNAFFSESSPPGDANDFDDNRQVDLNAAGALAPGIIATPDTSFIQNSLADLPENILIPDDLIANSCIARNEDGSSSFVITGGGGLPEQPGSTTAEYATGDVQPIPDAEGWHPGAPIIEPQGVYQLPNGELVLSHSCQ
ncbi:MAG: hypothetical protein AAF289_02085, partial [Cyanobacteria bacterium P01_A01_bin.135]